MYNKRLNKFHFNSLKVRTFFNSLFLKSDVKRWENDESLSLKWDVRTEKMSELIDSNSVVLEFGAGRMSLRNYLPKDCTYIPSDLVSRCQDMIVCDLNGKYFPFYDKYDVVFLSGVLEYIHDVPSLIGKLNKITNKIVCSYATFELNESNRLKHGWVNNYNEDTFCNMFFNLGFKIGKKTHWGNQVIFKFIK